MAAPTFVQENETAWNVSGGTKFGTNFSVLANDILVAFAIADVTEVLAVSGGSLTWTLQQSITTASRPRVYVWSAVVDTGKTMSLTYTASPGSAQWGGNLLQFRGSDGIGASASANAAASAPSLNLTTTQANSAIVVVNGDTSAADGTSRTWRTGAGTLTEQTYSRQATLYTAYGGYHADAGAVGTYTVGLTAPASQTYGLIAVEVTGTTAAAASILRQMMQHHGG